MGWCQMQNGGCFCGVVVIVLVFKIVVNDFELLSQNYVPF